MAENGLESVDTAAGGTGTLDEQVPVPISALEDRGGPAQESVRPAHQSARRSLGEWLLRTRSLREARAQGKTLSGEQRFRLGRARIAAEVAEHAIDPVQPFRSGQGHPIAISLYREAAHWALIAFPGRSESSDLQTEFDAADQTVLQRAAGGASELEQVRKALVDRSFLQTGRESTEQQQQDARLARLFVVNLIRWLEECQADRKLLRQRRRRIVGVTLAFVVVALGIWMGLRAALRPPNFAAGKPWRASTSYAGLDARTQICEGKQTSLIFHTLDEASPWWEVDLVKPRSISRVSVTNRSDCCADRAVPLAVEVSLDRENWAEVARRNEVFSVWEAKFSHRPARYVRLRALRKTILHFENVAVR